MQSRLASLIESCVNVGIGFSVSLLANLAVLPAFGYPVTVHDAFGMGLIFTAISVVRSYLVRRFFNFRLTCNLAIDKLHSSNSKKEET